MNRRFVSAIGTGPMAMSVLGAETQAAELAESRHDTNKILLIETPLPASAIGAPEGSIGNTLGQKVNMVRIGFRLRSGITGGVFGVRTEPAQPQ